MNDNTIIPCPFCGGEGTYACIDGAYGAKECFVCCADCHARGASYCVRDDICAKEKAIESWNSRATLPRADTIRVFAEKLRAESAVCNELEIIILESTLDRLIDEVTGGADND